MQQRSNVSVCLDAFAVLAWLQNEPGAAQVETFLQQASEQETEKCFVSLLNLGEAYYQLARKRGIERADDFWDDALRGVIPLTVVDVTRKRVLEAGRLKARYPIALADAFAVELAQELGLPLVTGDPEIEAPAKSESSLQVIWLSKRAAP
jgi:predicted nucleic acid-binding protein